VPEPAAVPGSVVDPEPLEPEVPPVAAGWPPVDPFDPEPPDAEPLPDDELVPLLVWPVVGPEAGVMSDAPMAGPGAAGAEP
jgi:hypothetical protein